ncbi:opioid growth factor receptor [Takifugu rubripes]|uniref:Opioid growth factor receptor n=1 Tax=Takifugu rubripes TaxID=31033 RepID=A0A3B5KBL5_TAKRU|nr:opioid growth factor receptor-like protein 1 [Takifugu rubripes]XP_011600926.2 opioid growth factor receptor-like protein 1 [Takifugu rubripes]
MEDDDVCEYDSTWDTESDGDDPAGESQTRRSCPEKNRSGWSLNWHHTSRNMRAAKDMQNYRREYPNLTDDECSEDKMNNLQFYLNKYPSAPDDVYIDSFLKDWKNDYKRLERVHSYIQWLFPLREPGVNYMASELTKKEIKAFKENEDAKKRLVEAYELMLGFYGIRLVNKETGEVKRAENWKERFGNLERNMHNNLRITRILKSLGELGFRHYQAPLVRFFLEETLVKKTLGSVKRSVLDYFLFAVRDKEKRQELVHFAYNHFEPKDKFVWCPRKIQKQFKKAEKCKDGEAVEDGAVRVAKEPRGAEKRASKDKNKPHESPQGPKTDAEAARNGNPDAESGNEMSVNGESFPDDVDDMDQSFSPDTVTMNKPCAGKEAELSDASKEADNMLTDGEEEAEKKPKKKREEKPQSNGAAAALASSPPEERGGAGKPTGQAGSSGQTPLKTLKHSPSPFLGREEKIPRTDFSEASDKKEDEGTSQADASATNGPAKSAQGGESEPANGKDPEDVDMESQASTSVANAQNS